MPKIEKCRDKDNPNLWEVWVNGVYYSGGLGDAECGELIRSLEATGDGGGGGASGGPGGMHP